jgi:hypothetical protein
MKKEFKTLIVLLTVIVLASACTVVNKTAGVDRSKFVGTWVVSNVGYEGVINGTVQKIFDQAAPQYFVGSTWQLTNSGNALYTLANGTAQSIYWSYYNPGGGVEPLFQFKKVYQGDKAKNVDDGYRLNIGNADGNNLVLKVPVNIDGKTGYVVLTFVKK